MKANSPTTTRQTMRPNSSPATAKTKSACASGRTAFTWTTAPQSAIGKSLDRAVHLITVTGRWVEEMIDPDPDMRQVEIGAHKPPEPGESSCHHPVEPQPSHEKLCEPHDRDDKCHANVGLLDQHAADREKQRDGNQIAGKAGAQLLLGEQPRGDHGKGRLDEFRRLQRQPWQIDPPSRAFDLGADDKGQRQQRQPDHEPDDGDAADRPRRLKRDDEHHPQRQRQHGKMAADEVKPVIADPLGNRGTRRQAQDYAEPDQHAYRREAPAIDGPPPASHGALIDAGKLHSYRSSRRVARSLLSNLAGNPSIAWQGAATQLSDPNMWGMKLYSDTTRM